MTQIFISYKREDEEFARRLHSELRDWGYLPWLDVIEIKPGSDWDTSIHEGLRASDIVVGVIAPESLASKNVLDEWAYALSNNKHLLLIWLRPVSETDIPPRYIRNQRINFLKDEEQGLLHLQRALSEYTSSIKAVFKYTILSLEEVSFGLTKRYSASVMTNPSYPKAALREVVKKATLEIKQSRYYVSKISEERYGDRDADCVFIFLYVDPSDNRPFAPNWICRTRWVRNGVDKPGNWEADEIIQITELDGDLEVDWKYDYEVTQETIAQQVGNKEDWVRKIEKIIPEVEMVVLEARKYLKSYEDKQIDEQILERELSRLEDDALKLYQEAGNQKFPPLDCAECDSVFQSMMASFHNIFVPFAKWAKKNDNWKSKMWLLKDYLKRYEKKTGVCLRMAKN